LNLRVKDLDFAQHQIIARNSKEYESRVTLLPTSLVKPLKLYHLHESGVQKALKQAVRATGIMRRVGFHRFRHCFFTHLLEVGYDIRTVQELLGSKDGRTTMTNTHVLNRSGRGV